MKDQAPYRNRSRGRSDTSGSRNRRRTTPERVERPKWLQKSPKEIDLVFFDLETTGGNPSNSKIIEIAAIKYSRGQEIARFETLVNPKRRIPRVVQEITNISQDMVKAAPTIEEVIDDFVDFLGDSVLVAHGALNDYSFVKQSCHEYVNRPFTNYYLCTHLIVSNLLPDLPSKTLSGTARHFGSEVEDAHRAMVDAEMTRDVLMGLVRFGRSHGVHSTEDFLKIQGDNETLRRLGPGLSGEEIETVPPSPGVFYFFNSQGEINFLSASPNLRRSFSQITALSEERELNRLVVDLSDYKFQRHNHFLGALLAEGKELSKFDLALDPRQLEGRSKGFVQILLPQDLLGFITDNPENSGLDVFGDRGRVSETVREFETLYSEKQLPPAPDPEGRETYAQTQADLEEFINSGAGRHRRGPIRKTRIAYPSRARGKFSLAREEQVSKSLQCGKLSRGVGWVFGPYEQPKLVQKEFEKLAEILPFHDERLGFNRRLLFLRLFIGHVYGRLGDEINALERQKRTTRYFLNLSYRRTLNDTLNRLHMLGKLELPVGRDYLPQSGLAIVSNTDAKELDIAVVVRNRIREVIRLPIEDSDKIQSKRFFTRLFCKHNDELTHDSFPLLFTDEVCADLELFHHWKKFRSLEGDWVYFEDLAPLYDLGVI